jgi:hypothetical protein
MQLVAKASYNVNSDNLKKFFIEMLNCGITRALKKKTKKCI